MTNPSLLQTMSAAIDLHREHQRTLAAPRDPPPDAVPQYLLNKRAPSQPKEPAMASFSDLIASAHALMSKRSPSSADLETALDALQRADAIVDKAKARAAVADDEDDFESPSDTTGNGFDEEDDDEEEDGGVKTKKADYSYSLPHYGGTASPQTPAGPGSGPHQSADPYATDSWSTAGTPSKTSFDDRVDMVMARDQVTRSSAMTRARNEFPADYQRHQASLVAGSTRDSHARRSASQATKAAPTFYEDLVAEQMAKGCNYEMAAQRVCQAHGYDAFNNRMLAKGSQDIEARFRKIVKSLAYEHDLGLEEATRLARKRNPHLYWALNSV
jgi:hypothetical protein